MIPTFPFLSPLPSGASPFPGQASWPDNGYCNLKTASGIFPASVLTLNHEPAYAQDLLIYDGKYHVIGSGHREFTPDKVSNPDHYVLTLAGIGQELWKNRMTKARVYIAAGLPLTWTSGQKADFKAI